MQQIYWRALLGLTSVERVTKAGLAVGEDRCVAVTELPMFPLLASDSDWDGLSRLPKLEVRGLGR